ncbi:MAG: 2'-5' RNA ligase [Clostridiales bacterium 38-18]|nr:MAG: 2'-5' RNA ligase [Clostridiales bacterium 38-18]
MRIFIGVDLPESLKSDIFQLEQKIQEQSNKGNWKPADSFHITLRFLGEIEETEVKSIAEGLRSEIKGFKPFSLNLKGGGTFDAKGEEQSNIRVLWLGVDGDLKALNRLYFQTECVLDALCYPRDHREYTPHITLGQSIKLKGGLNTLAPYFKTLNSSFEVTAVTIFISEVVSGKRSYRPIERIEF